MKKTSPERLLVYAGFAILVFLFLWFQLNLVLLAFAGILVAVILRTVTEWIDRHTRLSGKVAYAGTLLLIGAVAAGLGYVLVPRAITQISELVRSLPSSIHNLEQPLEQSSWGRDLLDRVHRAFHNSSISSQIPQIAGAVSSGVTGLVIVLVVGFFAALNPHGYAEGMLVLFPERRRGRARRIAAELERQLQWWTLGQMLPMAVLGIVSGVGLSLLHVALPWTLGLLTGLAVFLPYAGTVLSGIPAVLMGLQRSPHTALWVLLLYTALHLLEGYILTPFVQRKAVRLPPVVTILVQYFFWQVAGILGLALAAPLASAGIVLVKELYLHVPAEQSVVPETPAARAA
ncbi:MAG TPA: AI-2E family transporter [Acidobacteriaceae bacterium]|jgi:predicted PurR-regulated permease PerM|nr:AI-2E family transporter [Acidobacteriaceae bacterium]